jgi:predicted alpha/beta-fold hydrolase
MTLYAWAKNGPCIAPAAGPRFSTSPLTRALAQCNWQQDRKAPTFWRYRSRGSSEAHYMRGLAEKAFAAGFNVVRLNQRNCGGTEHLSRALSLGLTADPLFVLSELRDRDGFRFVVAIRSAATSR